MGEKSAVENPVVRYASATYGIKSKKLSTVGPYGDSGWPDRMFVFPRGWVVFIEFKAPGSLAKGNNPTELQADSINHLRGFDHAAYVVDSKEEGKAIIDTWMDAARSGKRPEYPRDPLEAGQGAKKRRSVAPGTRMRRAVPRPRSR